MATNVYTIAAGEPFADTLVSGIVERIERIKPSSDPFALADATVFVPTRRAARTLNEAFGRHLGGGALLPQIRPLGDIDGDELEFDVEENLSLPRVIDPVRRRLLLATLIVQWDRARRGGESTFTFAQGAALARGLENFLDEAETQGADLGKLGSLAEGTLALHWSKTREFLEFARDEWPKILSTEGAVDPARRRNMALAALAEKYLSKPTDAHVIAAGTTGSIPATAALLRAIAGLPNGAVVLPGLDRELDEESWSRLDEGHWQFGMKQLLERMEIDRKDVRDWTDGTGIGARVALVRETLRPAPTTDAWRALSGNGKQVAQGLSGLSLIEAAHPAEEALIVALILRETVEHPQRTAALVTPDRNLARRVAAELKRWDVVIDDSAGRPFSNTPTGVFLSLLANAAREEFAPVPLLSLLKQPLASGGMETSSFRHRARDLDRLVLRGPRPDRGLEGIAKAIEAAGRRSHDCKDGENISILASWFSELAAILTPWAEIMQRPVADLGDIVRLHIRTAEALAATQDEHGDRRLWHDEAGAAAAELMDALVAGAEHLPPQSPASYPELFGMFAEGVAVRLPYGGHPRLAILGPLEARLQQFDVMVLAGLNEGSWPASAPVDPWLSRPMRKNLGLEAPERRVGLSAHDFAVLAANPRVLLTRSLRSEGAPTVASRWIERLRQLTKGLGLARLLEPSEPWREHASRLDLPEKAPSPEPRPNPRPPVRLRPRSLSVTEIETWLRDPYAIYARRILDLKVLEPLDADIGPLERGTAIHLILERFVRDNPGEIDDNSLPILLATADTVFAESAVPHAVLSVWRPKFEHAAKWFLDLERRRRTAIARTHIEISGRCTFPGPHGVFALRGRADRIDILKDGRAAIIDYKTGEPPTKKQVELFLAPQLPLEGAMLMQGAFLEIGMAEPAELAYVRIGGGPVPGKYISILSDVAELAKESASRLVKHIAAFDDEDTPYTSRVVPFKARIRSEYDHLARVLEWSSSGWKEES